jgi:50S ribosomal protein L16 3-hydroxylase
MNIPILGNITAEEFLRDYWQKKPLLIRQAIPDFVSPIDGDELAGLSLESEVESRIILEHGEEPWELRHGPFTEQTYAELPESHWTLLVQAVDQFVPEVADYLKDFEFLPRWRIDDLMISYAAPGGGVGPHFDNYDVFLLQAEGRREWKTGQLCDSDSPLLPHPDLRILDSFETTNSWVLEPGDMLYLPPRLAHWGTALDNCMTWSIGFRAPSSAEIITHYTDFVARFLSDEDRYADADLSPVQDPAEIRLEDIQRLRNLVRQQLDDDNLLLSWFGQHMTEPKYPEFLQGHETDTDSLLDFLRGGGVLARNPAARLAWSYLQLDGEQAVLLFSCGKSRPFPEHLVGFVQLLCSQDFLTMDNLHSWLDRDEAVTLLCELVKQGSLEYMDE